MKRRYSLAHLSLAVVVALSLIPLMVVVDAQAQIAFVSKRDGNPEIYLMDINGKNPRRLTNNRHEDWHPAWSPDGKRIVFMSNRDGHPHLKQGLPSYDIYVMDANGGNPQNLTNNPPAHDRDPSWSPDGERIVFASVREEHFSFEIYVMDDDGGNQQRLTENLRNDMFPSWSPNGKRIAFASDRKADFENFEIYIMDADGGHQQRLTNNREYDWSPSWSSDGERIAFMSERDGDGNSEIYVIDDDGGNPQNLTNNPKRDSNPAWFNSPFSVAPVGKKFTIWGQLKQVKR